MNDEELNKKLKEMGEQGLIGKRSDVSPVLIAFAFFLGCVCIILLDLKSKGIL